MPADPEEFLSAGRASGPDAAIYPCVWRTVIVDGCRPIGKESDEDYWRVCLCVCLGEGDVMRYLVNRFYRYGCKLSVRLT